MGFALDPKDTATALGTIEHVWTKQLFEAAWTEVISRFCTQAGYEDRTLNKGFMSASHSQRIILIHNLFEIARPRAARNLKRYQSETTGLDVAKVYIKPPARIGS